MIPSSLLRSLGAYTCRKCLVAVRSLHRGRGRRRCQRGEEPEKKVRVILFRASLLVESKNHYFFVRLVQAGTFLIGAGLSHTEMAGRALSFTLAPPVCSTPRQNRSTSRRQISDLINGGETTEIIALARGSCSSTSPSTTGETADYGRSRPRSPRVSQRDRTKSSAID
jgi:hypothetical protein